MKNITNMRQSAFRTAKQLSLSTLIALYRLTKFAIIASLGALVWIYAGPIGDALAGLFFNLLHVLGRNPNGGWGDWLLGIGPLLAQEHARHLGFNYAYVLPPVIMGSVYLFFNRFEAWVQKERPRNMGPNLPENVSPAPSQRSRRKRVNQQFDAPVAPLVQSGVDRQQSAAAAIAPLEKAALPLSLNLNRPRAKSFGAAEDYYPEHDIHRMKRHFKNEPASQIPQVQVAPPLPPDNGSASSFSTPTSLLAAYLTQAPQLGNSSSESLSRNQGSHRTNIWERGRAFLDEQARLREERLKQKRLEEEAKRAAINPEHLERIKKVGEKWGIQFN